MIKKQNKILHSVYLEGVTRDIEEIERESFAQEYIFYLLET